MTVGPFGAVADFAVEAPAASSGTGSSVPRLATFVPAAGAAGGSVFAVGICPAGGPAEIAAGAREGNTAVARATVCLSSKGAPANALGGGGRWLVAAVFPSIAGSGAAIFDSGGGTDERATICVSTAGVAATAFGTGSGECPEAAAFPSFTGTVTITLDGGARESRAMVSLLVF